MRKKSLTFLLALVTSVGLMNAAVDDSGSCGENVTYSFNGATGAMTITGTGPMTDYASISDVPWNSYRDDITSVTITDGVTSVGSYSFGYHENLVTVTIGNNVETIGEYAFGDCYKFTTLNLGNSVRHIGNRAFMWAKVLTGFTLPSTLETIGERAFLQNKVITSLTIPSNVTSIGEAAFFYCAALTSVTVEATTPPTLGATVFDYVPTSSIPLYVPNGSVAAYEAAAQWTDFNIQGSDPSDPGSGEEPGGGSPTPTNPSGSCGTNLSWEFDPSTGTLTITGSGAMPTIWDSPSSVSWHAYRADITSVSLPDGLTTIGGYAFYSCPGLTSVTIPENVTDIAIAAFASCANLASVTLPNSVLSIGQSALALCPSMTSLTLGSGLSSIGTAAFSGCSGLESVTNYATTPQVLDSYAFYNVGISNCELYVPEESVAAYQAATTWKDFKNVQAIGPAPTGVNITANQDPDPQHAGVYYATFFDSSKKYALPTGVEAYVATINVNELDLTKIAEAGQVIPANNAVILKSTVSPFSLTPSDAAAVTFTATNDLQGVDVVTPVASVVTGTCYVLSGNASEGVGFFVYNATNLQAHKAYIDLNGGAGAPRRMRFVFETEQTATDLEEINTTSNAYKIIRDGQLIIIRNGVEYNVNGQEVK